jgi:hypothetical protein
MIAEALLALSLQGNPAALFDIQEKWLYAEEVEQFDFTRKYMRQHGELPPFDLLQDKFNLKVRGKPARFAHYVEELKKRFVYTTLIENLPAQVRAAKGRPLETLAEIKQLIASVEDVRGQSDLNYSRNAESRIDRYNSKIGTDGITYISTGDPILDMYLHGYNKSDLVTIAGKSGLKKSWLLVELAIKCNRSLSDIMGPTLFVTNEMPDTEIVDRMDCYNFKLPYNDFLEGTLDLQTLTRYKKGLRRIQDIDERIEIIYNCNTFDALRQKIMIYQPSVLFLDGAYLMEPGMPEDWTKIVHITRNLKQLAKDTGVPIICTTQLKRGSKNVRSKLTFDAQEDFAWGSSFVQDSDVAIRGYQDAQMQYYSQVGLEFAKGRRIKPGAEIIWTPDLDTMNFTFEEMNDDEFKKFTGDNETVNF